MSGSSVSFFKNRTFFRQEEKLTEVSEEKKKEMIESVQGLSTFEAERTLLRNSVEPVRHAPEKVRVVSETALQIQFTATREQMALFEEVRGLMAHTDSHLSWSELFEKMARIAKQKLDPTEKKCRTVYPQRRDTQNSRRESRTVSAGLRREVLARDLGKCVRCNSTFALEIDHIQPWMFGGETKLENLRTLCRNCNQREAVRAFGVKKIEKESGRAGVLK